MNTPKETALELCQNIGMVTMFDKECNDGMTLPLHVVKKIAKVSIEVLRKSDPTDQDLDEILKEIEIL